MSDKEIKKIPTPEVIYSLVWNGKRFKGRLWGSGKDWLFEAERFNEKGLPNGKVLVTGIDKGASEFLSEVAECFKGTAI